MVLELILKAIFSLIDLLKGSFFIAIIAFAIVFFASFFHSWLSKKHGFSWLKATMLTSYLAIFILIILLYSLPVFFGFEASDQGVVPSFFQMSPADWLLFIAMIVFRNAIIALLFTFFILPMEFLASMVFDYLNEKFKANKWVNIFIAVFAACIATSVICLFLLPWIVPGLIYLTFYWHL